MAPALSVILLTPDRLDTIRATLGHLEAQTARDVIEVIVVGPAGSDLHDAPDVWTRLGAVQVIEVDTLGSTALARAEAVRRAMAPVVVFAEDHCYPEADWAAALIDAHANGWAGVGPVLSNANPGAVSWAALLADSARWLHPAEGGTIDDLQGRNGSYKRDTLLAFGDELGPLLEAETILHQRLLGQGEQLYLAPHVRVHHTNISDLGRWLHHSFLVSRVFAASRAGAWGLGRRAVYTGGSPLLPLVRLWKIGREMRRPGRPFGVFVRVLPVLSLGLAVSAVGEMAGYAAGGGTAAADMRDLEFHR